MKSTELPTLRQAGALRVLYFKDRAAASAIGVRSDVLWRMEERGWVARNSHGQWHATDAGRRALDRYDAEG